jgi:3-isopropylmalate/(R)-2-methylmalate dehydratase large subunit
VRAVVIPGSQKVYLDALREGLIEVFIEANCSVSTSTCGPCLGGHMGVLAAGERCVSTSNRNFRGRMGHATSEVYLANPYVAAASAIAGCIASPAEVLPAGPAVTLDVSARP